jgi:hypothetical protein
MSEFVVTVRRRSDVGFEDSSPPAGPAVNSVVTRQPQGPAMQSFARPVGPAMNSVALRQPAGAAMNSVPGLSPNAQRPLGPAMSSTNGNLTNGTNGT